MPASVEPYQSPELLYVLCLMSAMAFVVSAYRWFWEVRKSALKGEEFQQTFSVYIWRGQMLNLVFAMVVSIVLGVSDYFMIGKELNITGEVIFLIVFLGALSWYSIRQKKLSAFFGALRDIFWLGFLCLAGWGVTIGLGFAFSKILKMSVMINSSDFDMLIIFLPGLLWNVPLYRLYHKTLQSADRRAALKGRRFHDFLWPILLAYIMVSVPVASQEIVNSKQWAEMKNYKILKRA